MEWNTYSSLNNRTMYREWQDAYINVLVEPSGHIILLGTHYFAQEFRPTLLVDKA